MQKLNWCNWKLNAVLKYTFDNWAKWSRYIKADFSALIKFPILMMNSRWMRIWLIGCLTFKHLLKEEEMSRFWTLISTIKFPKRIMIRSTSDQKSWPWPLKCFKESQRLSWQMQMKWICYLYLWKKQLQDKQRQRF